MKSKGDNIRHLLMRIGLAAVLIIFGIWEIMNPKPWASFLPPMLSAIGNPLTLVTIHGVVIILLGIAILTGFFLRISAILAALVLLFTIISLLMLTGYEDIVVRDAGLFLLALALVFDDTRYMALTKR